MRINCKTLGVDLISISGHKIHGPKGIGALYIKRGTNIKPIIFGGGQEKGIRSGTEPTPLIAGFLGALRDMGDITQNRKNAEEISAFLRERLSEIEGVKINSPEDALPYILNFSLVGYRSETVLHFLEERDIFVSSGSACSKGKASNVLSLMGLSDKEIDSSVRLSFSRFNTLSQAEVFVNEIKNATKCIRKAY
jgi:cysteine desulfurase